MQFKAVILKEKLFKFIKSIKVFKSIIKQAFFNTFYSVLLFHNVSVRGDILPVIWSILEDDINIK